MLDLGQNDLIICKKNKNNNGKKGLHYKILQDSDLGWRFLRPLQMNPMPLSFQFLKRTNEVKYSRMLTHIKIKCTQIL